MRLSADAKAYASGVKIFNDPVPEPAMRELLAAAFQHGMEHAKASQRRLQKLTEGRT
jgi:hypothetical protein